MQYSRYLGHRIPWQKGCGDNFPVLHLAIPLKQKIHHSFTCLSVGEIPVSVFQQISAQYWIPTCVFGGRGAVEPFSFRRSCMVTSHTGEVRNWYRTVWTLTAFPFIRKHSELHQAAQIQMGKSPTRDSARKATSMQRDRGCNGKMIGISIKPVLDFK